MEASTTLMTVVVVLAGAAHSILLPVAHLSPGTRLARTGAARRPLSSPGWSGPGRGRRRWPAQLHPGSGPRQRPSRP